MNENTNPPPRLRKRTNTKLPLGHEKCLRRLTKEISSIILRYRSEHLGMGNIDNSSDDPGVDLYHWSNSKQRVGYISGRIKKDKTQTTKKKNACNHGIKEK